MQEALGFNGTATFWFDIWLGGINVPLIITIEGRCVDDGIRIDKTAKINFSIPVPYSTAITAVKEIIEAKENGDKEKIMRTVVDIVRSLISYTKGSDEAILINLLNKYDLNNYYELKKAFLTALIILRIIEKNLCNYKKSQQDTNSFSSSSEGVFKNKGEKSHVPFDKYLIIDIRDFGLFGRRFFKEFVEELKKYMDKDEIYTLYRLKRGVYAIVPGKNNEKYYFTIRKPVYIFESKIPGLRWYIFKSALKRLLLPKGAIAYTLSRPHVNYILAVSGSFDLIKNADMYIRVDGYGINKVKAVLNWRRKISDFDTLYWLIHSEDFDEIDAFLKNIAKEGFIKIMDQGLKELKRRKTKYPERILKLALLKKALEAFSSDPGGYVYYRLFLIINYISAEDSKVSLIGPFAGYASALYTLLLLNGFDKMLIRKSDKLEIYIPKLRSEIERLKEELKKEIDSIQQLRKNLLE